LTLRRKFGNGHGALLNISAIPLYIQQTEVNAGKRAVISYDHIAMRPSNKAFTISIGSFGGHSHVLRVHAIDRQAGIVACDGARVILFSRESYKEGGFALLSTIPVLL